MEREIFKKEIDVSNWKFEENLYTVPDIQFNPYSHHMPSTHQKQIGMKNINKEIEDVILNHHQEIKNVDLFDMESFDSEDIYKLHKTDIIEKIKDQENQDLVDNLEEQEGNFNPYLLLVNRLDEEEGIRIPSIDDKLKLAEDHLRVSTNDFSKTCKKLLKFESDVDEQNEKEILFSPQQVSESFKPKSLDLSLEPSETLQIGNTGHEPLIEMLKSDLQGKIKEQKDRKSLMKLKQGFYLPSDTWFTGGKQINDMTFEELELLSSTSTKAFLQFLKERKKQPPKLLLKIQKKLEELKEQEIEN